MNALSLCVIGALAMLCIECAHKRPTKAERKEMKRKNKETLRQKLNAPSQPEEPAAPPAPKPTAEEVPKELPFAPAWAHEASFIGMLYETGIMNLAPKQMSYLHYYSTVVKKLTLQRDMQLWEEFAVKHFESLVFAIKACEQVLCNEKNSFNLNRKAFDMMRTAVKSFQLKVKTISDMMAQPKGTFSKAQIIATTLCAHMDEFMSEPDHLYMTEFIKMLSSLPAGIDVVEKSDLQESSENEKKDCHSSSSIPNNANSSAVPVQDRFEDLEVMFYCVGLYECKAKAANRALQILTNELRTVLILLNKQPESDCSKSLNRFIYTLHRSITFLSQLERGDVKAAVFEDVKMVIAEIMQHLPEQVDLESRLTLVNLYEHCVAMDTPQQSENEDNTSNQ